MHQLQAKQEGWQQIPPGSPNPSPAAPPKRQYSHCNRKQVCRHSLGCQSSSCLPPKDWPNRGNCGGQAGGHNQHPPQSHSRKPPQSWQGAGYPAKFLGNKLSVARPQMVAQPARSAPLRVENPLGIDMPGRAMSAGAVGHDRGGAAGSRVGAQSGSRPMSGMEAVRERTADFQRIANSLPPPAAPDKRWDCRAYDAIIPCIIEEESFAAEWVFSAGCAPWVHALGFEYQQD